MSVVLTHLWGFEPQPMKQWESHSGWMGFWLKVRADAIQLR